MIGIIGGGVAGMSCALWLKHLGFKPVIIERNAKLGGQLLKVDRINRWVLGAVDKTGIELAKLYADHIAKEGITVFYQTHLQSIACNTNSYDLVVANTDDACPLSVSALVVATGVRVLGHEIFDGTPGFQSAYETGRISFFPLDHLDKLSLLKGKTVAVIGGGNNAFYTALDLASVGAKVCLLVRSQPKARESLQNEAKNLIGQNLLEQHIGRVVNAFGQNPDGKMEISLSGKDKSNERIAVDWVFVRAGFAPNIDFMAAFPAFNGIQLEHGYVKTDSAKRTSLPWIYAIGDITNGKHQSVVSAIADGAVAAQDLAERI